MRGCALVSWRLRGWVSPRLLDREPERAGQAFQVGGGMGSTDCSRAHITVTLRVEPVAIGETTETLRKQPRSGFPSANLPVCVMHYLSALRPADFTISASGDPAGAASPSRSRTT